MAELRVGEPRSGQPKVPNSKQNSNTRPRTDKAGGNGSDESGRGQPHPKTLSRRLARNFFRKVLECGCPLPLFLLRSARAARFIGLMVLQGVAILLTSAATIFAVRSADGAVSAVLSFSQRFRHT